MILALSALICIAGLLMIAFGKDARTQLIGDRMFFAGLLAFLIRYQGSGPVISLFR